MKEVKLSDNAQTVAKKRYYMNGENWEECTHRVASINSVAEVNDKVKYKELFHEMIYNMDFLPGGRILRNSGRARGSLFNCYHLPIGDSIEEIGQFYKDSLILASEGGGVGCNFTPLRPKGDAILGKGGVSSGLVSWITGDNAILKLIESGGSRRAAAIAHVDVSHPEVMDFIDAKLVHGHLSHFNISVSVTNDFLEAVEADRYWKFKFKQKTYGKVKARDIWNKIVDNMVGCAEPGLLNWNNFQKNNSYYFHPVTGTNPCHTGDTLVSVADGRNHISFRQLEKEGKDVPVYSLNDKTGNVEIQMMRNPRKTGFKQKIIKVFVDDNMYFRTNETHKITLFDGTIKQVKDLKSGDRLHHMIKYNANLSTILNLEETKSDYIWVNNGFQKNKAEHRIVGEFIEGRKLTKDEVVHHIDFNYQNNSIKNLKVMLKKDHDNYHGERIKGDNNPMRKFPEKNYFSKHKFLGIENGNSKGYTIEQLLDIAIVYVKDLKRRPILFEWKQYCEDNNYPFFSAELYQKYGGHKQFFDEVCKIVKIPVINQYLAKSYKKFLEIKNNSDLDIFWDNGIKVNKKCEICNNNFVVSWGAREQSYCSTRCACINANNIYMKKRSNGQNFKVIKIVEDGYEDVYNGTVDKNHNYYVFVGKNETKSNKPKLNYINSRNCGETTLGPYDVCDLGSLVLPNFITGNVNTNWKKLEQVIKLAVRFLDNIIEVNKYVLREIDINAHNSRRIGLGVLGIAEYLFAKKLRYGSAKSVVELEKLMLFIRNVAYQASVDLAIEKGSFPKFDPILYGKASFIRKLPAQLRMDIKKFGVRNVTLLAMAPTGTISLLTPYTSGVEPLFAKSYERRDRVGDRIYVHPMYKEFLTSKEEIPDWFVDSFDLKPEDHFEVQVAIQKYVDGGVSKTINLPKETNSDELSRLLLEYIYDLKGVTVYRDGCRPEQILNKINKEETIKYLKDKNKTINHELTDEDVQCATGSCEV